MNTTHVCITMNQSMFPCDIQSIVTILVFIIIIITVIKLCRIYINVFTQNVQRSSYGSTPKTINKIIIIIRERSKLAMALFTAECIMNE